MKGLVLHMGNSRRPALAAAPPTTAECRLTARGRLLQATPTTLGGLNLNNKAFHCVFTGEAFHLRPRNIVGDHFRAHKSPS